MEAESCDLFSKMEPQNLIGLEDQQSRCHSHSAGQRRSLS